MAARCGGVIGDHEGRWLDSFARYIVSFADVYKARGILGYALKDLRLVRV
jgi:hypothetical protein